MIEALFNQPNYVAAKKLLDVTTLRHEAIASNIANVTTPHYKRLDVAPAFATELRQALHTGEPARLAELRPRLGVDATAVAMRKDGNTVDLEKEMMQLTQNYLENQVEQQLITGSMLKLRLAITGRPS